ncbi:hypothetical protein [Teredinibacter sp. KSP-S5-2]|uniref:hypothetical protein n=1 Tax=Teredinibacter sp. KSP-S5-2 TaxID=3034506 RepID=UPI0029347300|nr:hypothetical protein [Teredinibacter sp. KSP-S5-2]WNO10161.1 hypothetical protein P5V12_03145 [Teredinibacter sp. KSP-S5-2]
MDLWIPPTRRLTRKILRSWKANGSMMLSGQWVEIRIRWNWQREATNRMFKQEVYKVRRLYKDELTRMVKGAAKKEIRIQYDTPRMDVDLKNYRDAPWTELLARKAKGSAPLKRVYRQRQKGCSSPQSLSQF